MAFVQGSTLRAASSAGEHTCRKFNDMHAVKEPRPSLRHIATDWLYSYCSVSIIKVVPQYNFMGTISLSEVVHEKLTEYRDQHQHTSYDSAVRELLREVEDE